MDSLDLDLHGKTWPEALQEFVEAYNRAVQPDGHTCRRLRVIHGYGSTGGPGILKIRFRRFLENHGSRLEFAPGEKIDGNPGYTTVTPKYPLPGSDAALCELVWDYCEQPKTLTKIVGQFRRFGNPQGATGHPLPRERKEAPQGGKGQEQRIPGRVVSSRPGFDYAFVGAWIRLRLI